MAEYNDKELLELFDREDQRVFAFERMVERYSPRIYWTVRKIVVSHYDTDDIVQNTFIKLWQSLPSFRGESSIYTWIYRIAVNQAISHLREKKRASGRFSAISVDDFDGIVTEEGYFDANEVEMNLQRAINTLPTKQRAVFIMRYYDETPFREISEIMGTSEGAVKASYHIAREKIEVQIKLLTF